MNKNKMKEILLSYLQPPLKQEHPEAEDISEDMSESTEELELQ